MLSTQHATLRTDRGQHAIVVRHRSATWLLVTRFSEHDEWRREQTPRVERGGTRVDHPALRSILKALDTFDLDHKKWPELAADRLAWRAMLHSGQAPPAYRAPPPTPAALPIANTRPQRASLAATTAAIQNSVQKLAATTRLGVKKKTHQNCVDFPNQAPTQTVSLIPTPRVH